MSRLSTDGGGAHGDGAHEVEQKITIAVAGVISEQSTVGDAGFRFRRAWKR